MVERLKELIKTSFISNLNHAAEFWGCGQCGKVMKIIQNAGYILIATGLISTQAIAAVTFVHDIPSASFAPLPPPVNINRMALIVAYEPSEQEKNKGDLSLGDLGYVGVEASPAAGGHGEDGTVSVPVVSTSNVNNGSNANSSSVIVTVANNNNNASGSGGSKSFNNTNLGEIGGINNASNNNSVVYGDSVSLKSGGKYLLGGVDYLPESSTVISAGHGPGRGHLNLND